MKNKLVLLIAILIGVLAFWLSARYLSREKDALYAGAVKIKVIAAAKDLPAMTVITAEDVGMLEVYKKAVGENVFLPEDFQRIKGKRLKYPVKKNSPIMWSQVDMPRVRDSGLSSIIKTRNRAISISISGAPAVSGLIKPNDHVDVLGTFTFPSRVNPQVMESVTLTLMQNVSVLATGAQIAGEEEVQNSRGGYSSVTFEVSPEEAEGLIGGRCDLGLIRSADRGTAAAFSHFYLNFLLEMASSVDPTLRCATKGSLAFMSTSCVWLITPTGCGSVKLLSVHEKIVYWHFP